MGVGRVGMIEKDCITKIPVAIEKKVFFLDARHSLEELKLNAEKVIELQMHPAVWDEFKLILDGLRIEHQNNRVWDIPIFPTLTCSQEEIIYFVDLKK